MRDTKRPTIIAIQYDKTGKHILITDLSGDAPSIIPKDDKDTLHEAITSIIENKSLPEFNLSQITVGAEEIKGQTTSTEGLNIQDLLSNPDKLKSAGLGTVLGWLQNASTYRR